MTPAVIHKIGQEFSIGLIDRPLSIPSSIQETVDGIWDEEKRRKGEKLFDGLILSAVEVSASRLVGRWVNYRYALAIYRQPHLAVALGVNPVAVNGLTLVGQQVLVAKRAAFVSQNPGCWELVPSGGIDPKAVSGSSIDYRRALLDELEEETGVHSALVESVEPFALHLDPSTSTWEMILKVHLKGDAVPKLTSTEYDEFSWVDKVDLQAFLEGKKVNEVVPLTRVIVEGL